ncbi:SDR family NAD(P)-dependent oxidoreductase [Listeria sp. SHR_NRA_18]|uniref:SDR family NAD(P)-dependent oxidoreductase n=1 Tax=Listeria sp. SHR_NRA_18 TaxID=2269046 RepID=UPI00051D80C7|nr:SDR family NAD(P)-dependent oxidoreductase [Listeria sp. SHR_NRA_18]KGL38574.1 short-chain dehydrogenase [Listeriaceae bacterium FSL A5-0209]RQW67932.1 SDR family NAD(P)-dependent oxidoreductase [Listeria sp. SHR_NRA_18]
MTITLITGGNAGLGFETARRLKEVGYKVYIGSRDAARGKEAAAELGVAFIVLDVTNEASVAQAATEIEKKEGHLDVLINNAGVSGNVASPEQITVDMMEQVYQVNVFGVVRATHHFLPLLQKSTQPIIVNVSSGLGSFGQVLNPEQIESKLNPLVYSSSKSAASMLTVQYAKGLPNMQINAVDPDPTKTGLTGQGHQTVQEGSDAIVQMATIDKDGPTGIFMSHDGIIPW